MKIQLLFIPIFFLILFLSSCKKENSTPIPVKPLILKQTTVSGFTTTSAQYKYDNSGRVINILFNDSTYTNYEYSGSSIHEVNYSLGGTIYYDVIYTLDAKGLAISSTVTAFANVKWTETFEYNANGFMIREVRTSSTTPSYTWDYTITGENIATEHFVMGTSAVTYTNYYLTGSANTIDLENTGILFRGKQSANLVDSAGINTSLMAVSAAYTYEYDNQKRVTKKTVSYKPAPFVSTTTYSYY